MLYYYFFCFGCIAIAYSLYYCVYTHASVYSTATLNTHYNNSKEYEYKGIHAESTVIVTPPCHSARRARVARMVARFNSVSNPGYVVYHLVGGATLWSVMQVRMVGSLVYILYNIRAVSCLLDYAILFIDNLQNVS